MNEDGLGTITAYMATMTGRLVVQTKFAKSLKVRQMNRQLQRGSMISRICVH